MMYQTPLQIDENGNVTKWGEVEILLEVKASYVTDVDSFFDLHVNQNQNDVILLGQEDAPDGQKYLVLSREIHEIS
jgi:predicted transcriptional regulator